MDRQPAARAAPAALKRASVVITCHNDRASIRAVIEHALESPCCAEVVVVDDRSSDDSAEIVRGFGDPRVRLLQQPRRMGKGAALRRGLLSVTSPLVIVQELGSGNDPADYEAVLRPLLEDEADVVCGTRARLREWVGRRWLTTVGRVVTGSSLTDLEPACHAFRREVVQKVDIEEDHRGVQTELMTKLARRGLRMRDVQLRRVSPQASPATDASWSKTLQALYCISRYGLVEPMVTARLPNPNLFEEADEEMGDALDSLDGADNYADWICEMVAPYLRSEILEVGAGHGTLTGRLARHGRVVATDLSRRCVERLRSRFAGHPGVEVVHGDAASAAVGRRFETIVLVNVLEHIEDDRGALEGLRALLVPGGHLVILVPAFPALYSRFDQMVGHYRRYRKGALVSLAYRSHLDVIEARYVNSVGALAWWVLATRLGRIPTQSWSVRLYDTAVVPLLRRLEHGRQLLFGQSVVLVARMPGGTADG